eukprot:7389413-Prymnesium_polylepis.2
MIAIGSSLAWASRTSCANASPRVSDMNVSLLRYSKKCVGGAVWALPLRSAPPTLAELSACTAPISLGSAPPTLAELSVCTAPISLGSAPPTLAELSACTMPMSFGIGPPTLPELPSCTAPVVVEDEMV